jgi:putative heme-binding domain-containing protein
MALALSRADRQRAAARYLEAVKAGDEFVWSGPLIELLGVLTGSDVRDVFREQWKNIALRDALLPMLTASPQEPDRKVYLDALDSPLTDSVNKAMNALESLPRDPSPEHLIGPLRLLRRLTLEPREGELRKRLVALIARQTGVNLELKETATDAAALRRAYQPVFDRFQEENPQLADRLLEGGTDLAGWTRRLKAVDWSTGSASRGEKIFLERGCQTCHAGPRALGPDLTGVTDRLSRDDLFTAVVAPSLDVSPLYRTTLVETRGGQVYSGMVAFESADGLILQTGATTTVRVANTDIAARQVGMRSLMPDQLLQGLDDSGLVDLYAYLRTLSSRSGGKK